MFLYTKSRHFIKTKTICVTFLYTKSLTLHGIFEIGVGMVHFYMQKQCIFGYIFLGKKSMQFTLRFYLHKARQFLLHSNMQKMHFALPLYI